MTSLRTYLYAGFVLALIAAIFALRSHWIGVGEDHIQARWDARVAMDKQASQEAQLQAEKRARNEEHAKQAEADRIAHEQDLRLQQQADRNRHAADAERSLHTTIATLNARLSAGGTSDNTEAGASADEARTARELLGQCAGRYRWLGSEADGLRDQVTGLQDYVLSVCRTTTNDPMGGSKK